MDSLNHNSEVNLGDHLFLFENGERLKSKTDGSTHLKYTRFRGGLGHLKIETSLRGEILENVMCECPI